MSKILYVLTTLPLVAMGTFYPYAIQNCGNGVPTPMGLQIDECPGTVCAVSRGANVSYQVVFMPERPGPSFQVEANYQDIFGPTSIPLSPNQSDGCRNLVLGSCPYKDHQLIVTRGTITIPNHLPTGIISTITATLTSPCGPVACALIRGYAEVD